MATVEEVEVESEQRGCRWGFLEFGEFDFIDLGTGYTDILTLQIELCFMYFSIFPVYHYIFLYIIHILYTNKIFQKIKYLYFIFTYIFLFQCTSFLFF